MECSFNPQINNGKSYFEEVSKNNFPKELIQIIFSYLDLVSLAIMSSISKDFKQLSSASSLWEKFFYKEYKEKKKLNLSDLKSTLYTVINDSKMYRPKSIGHLGFLLKEERLRILCAKGLAKRGSCKLVKHIKKWKISEQNIIIDLAKMIVRADPEVSYIIQNTWDIQEKQALEEIEEIVKNSNCNSFLLWF